MLVVARKKQVSESKGPSYTRPMCWKSGWGAVHSRLRGGRGDRWEVPAAHPGWYLTPMLSEFLPVSAFIRTSNVSVWLLI